MATSTPLAVYSWVSHGWRGLLSFSGIAAVIAVVLASAELKSRRFMLLVAWALLLVSVFCVYLVVR
jgi:hypothetical protein